MADQNRSVADKLADARIEGAVSARSMVGVEVEAQIEAVEEVFVPSGNFVLGFDA